MQLQLRYDNMLPQPVYAACIRGGTQDWLKEIDRWGMPIEALACYILPQSIHDTAPAGLFVVFKQAGKTPLPDLQAPYTRIANKLYVPVQASISPQVSPAEIKNLLPWEIQVFHPVAGLVGFGDKDRIDLADLFLYTAPATADWSFAHPGLPARPGLQAIQVVSPDAREIMEAIKEEIGQKPLDEIPKSGNDTGSALEKFTDAIKYALLKGLLGAGSLINRIIPEAPAGQGGNGLFDKLHKWLQQNFEELQRKRDSEIKRLLDLFDEDTSEALQYAIPLDSPYLNRGTERPSGALTRRSTQFNLNKLGGGRATDHWDLGSHYHDLRSRYIRAAQKEIERKDFKKAAYVYAHLLGDYASAANVLEQGGLYREAAAVYKDHLKNPLGAAQCLEKGRLYQEAIELYQELKMDEKTGDLYAVLGRDEHARNYYEKHVDTKLLHNDYLDAARVIEEKLDEKERAGGVLLNGWKSVYQPEPCLKKYFDTLPAPEEGRAEKAVRDIYTNHTPAHKRIAFLNVLEYLNKKKPNEQLAHTSVDIAYEIAHHETELGDTTALHYLRRFLPGDRLVGADASRYIAHGMVKPREEKSKAFHLDPSIQWISATWHRNQYLVAGIKDGFAQMARGNWYGNFEYYSWGNAIKPHTRFHWICAPYYSNQVFLHTSDEQSPGKKNLPKNKYFHEPLLVNSPSPLRVGNNLFVINEDKTICSIETANDAVTLHYYNMECRLLRSEQSYRDTPGPMPVLRHPSAELANDRKHYYTFAGNTFFTIYPGGVTRAFDFNTGIRLFASSHAFASFFLIISTNRGCYLARPLDGALHVEEEVFAEDLTPSLITIISESMFVMAESKHATVFTLAAGRPAIVKRYDLSSKIIAVLPTSNRHEFGAVEQSGRVNLLEIPG